MAARPLHSFTRPLDNDRGTELVPIVVKALPSERSQQEIQEAKKKPELDRKLTEFAGDLASYNDTKLLVGVTLFLAVVTGGLVVVSFFQMRDARKSIGISERNGKALIDLEALFLYVKVTSRSYSPRRHIRADKSLKPLILWIIPNLRALLQSATRWARFTAPGNGGASFGDTIPVASEARSGQRPEEASS